MATNEPTTSEPDSETETYSKVAPQCPVCRSGDLGDSHEDVPHSFEHHRVRVVCRGCGTRLTIEYQAIDVSWRDPGHETHSGVSQGRLSPVEHSYADAEQYPELPDDAVLNAFDWPLSCECGEQLTGNHIVAEHIRREHDIPDGAVLFHCPACSEDVVKTPDGDTATE